ncbi:type II toxin-antitoxin system RnlA family toxin [Fusibacter sp. 3D3]|uniref:type II toxin-antitoxin system RnlA family toxin n=1 Tax=Fusibacter sp. 3D3 TaxID=1048380 RepID=UPI000853043D|nr:type II toxin-antitoxin system RnlA family toxin [Fusibacter sp. 3D3]GAU78296.1 putative cell division protein [Fusibacter sp. 3D3]
MNERFKKLHINQDLILSKIEQFLKENTITYEAPSLIPKDSKRHRAHIKYKDIEFYLDFFFNNDQTTTIDVTGGQNQHLKLILAYYLISSEICSLEELDPFKNSWFVVHPIEKDTIECIIDILEANIDDNYLLNKEISTGLQGRIWKLKGKFGEKVVIHYYNATNKVMVQGKPRLLFTMITTGISELLDSNVITNSFNDYFKIDIKKETINHQLAHYLPNLNASITPKLKNSFLQAIYNLNIDGDMFDYTFMTFPAYRGLEGHLRYLFKTHGINADKFIVKEFDYDEKTDFHILKTKYYPSFDHSTNKIAYINKVYSKYRAVRNNIFHWDSPIGTFDNTVIFNDIDIAKTHIIEVLQLVNEYYTLL